MHGPYGPPPAATGWGALDITTDYSFMQWALAFTSPVIEINGQPIPKPWGRQVIPLAPGNYMLRVYFSYMFSSQAGLAMVQLPIYPGQATMAFFNAPFFMFSAGDLAVRGARPM